MFNFYTRSGKNDYHLEFDCDDETFFNSMKRICEVHMDGQEIVKKMKILMKNEKGGDVND